MTKETVYLVGGAVRDALLNKPVKERDWVVVGATPQLLLAQGYRPVGKDFPVFLHPTTQEEYALARCERKVAPGYQGFQFHAEPDVTLEQDLSRRDLTINAIAQAKDGTLIDPFHGADDLKHRLLRHVSDAFSEDPVRLLRIARFACYLPDFSIHPETMLLLKSMVAKGEVHALVAERVWAECVKAMRNDTIQPFFETLNQCGALPIIFPGLALDAFNFDAYIRCAHRTDDTASRWAALCIDIPQTICDALMQTLKTPAKWQELVRLVQHGLSLYNIYQQLSAEALLQWFTQADAFRRQARFTNALDILAICTKDSLPKKYLIQLLDKLNTISVAMMMKQGIQGAEIAQALEEQRLQMINAYNTNKDTHGNA